MWVWERCCLLCCFCLLLIGAVCCSWPLLLNTLVRNLLLLTTGRLSVETNGLLLAAGLQLFYQLSCICVHL